MLCLKNKGIIASLSVAILCTSVGNIAVNAEISSTLPTDGLVGYWSLDENVDNQISNDETLPVWSGTLSGETLPELTTDGKINSGMNFTHTDQNNGSAIVLDNISSEGLVNANGITVSAWIKADDYENVDSNNFYTIFSAVNDDNKNAFSLCVSDKKGIVNLTTRKSGDSANYGYMSSEQTMEAGEWYHVVGVVDYSKENPETKIYINNVLTSATVDKYTGGTDAVFAKSNTNVKYEIGRRAFDGNASFDGIIDEVMLYNRALSDEEISSIYKLTSVPVKLGFESIEGDVINDSSENGWNGTIVHPTESSLVEGKVGEGIYFNGLDTNATYINMGTPTYLQNAKGVTVSTWIKLDDNDAASRSIFTSISPTCGSMFNLRIDNGYPVLTIRAKGNTASQQVQSWAKLEVDTWYYITGIVDFVNHEVAIYKNGIKAQKTELDDSYDIMPDDLQKALIGQHSFYSDTNPTTNNTPFKGVMDEFMIYDRALTELEVKELYDQYELEGEPTENTVSLNFEGNVVENIENGKTYTSVANIDNKEDGVNYTLITALYKKENDGLRFVDATLSDEISVENKIYSSIEVPNDNSEYTIKLYLWDMQNNLKPLINEVTY